jgi:lipopolysaccharide heptosyltransferase II
VTFAQMKLLDGLAGQLLCSALTLCARVAPVHRTHGPVARRDGNVKILAIKFWGMGSIVLSAPMIRALRRAFPDGRLAFLTLGRNREVVDLLPWVDRVYTLDIDHGFLGFLSSFWRMVHRLRAERFDLVLDLEFFTRFSAIVTYLTAAPERVGFQAWNVWRGRLHTRGVPFNPYWHVTRNFANLPRAIGVEVAEPPDSWALRIRESEGRQAASVLAAHGLAGHPTVCVNPNCGEIALTRRWPADRFAELSRRVLARFPSVRLALIGARKEHAYVQTIVQAIADPRAVNLAGTLSIPALARVLERSVLLVSNDSGPLHLAVALGTPTVSFFGPETPVIYGPRGPAHTVLYAGIDCSPCINVHEHKTSRCDRASLHCLESIEVGEAWEAVRTRLAQQLS